MPKRNGREIIGARFDSDARFGYASLPEEEADGFYAGEMNTGPEIPLAATDAEEEILYVNEDEHWGFAQDAVPEVERPSGDYLGWRWEEDPELATEFDSAQQYAEASQLDVEVVDSERITALVDLYMERNLPDSIETYSITVDKPGLSDFPLR